MLSPYILICIAVAVVHLCIGTSVLLKAPRNRTNQAFYVAIMALVLWILCNTAIVVYSEHLGTRAVLTRLAYACGIFTTGAVATFCMVFASRKGVPRKSFTLMLLICTFFLVLALLPGAVLKGFRIDGTDIIEVHGPFRSPYYITLAFLFSYGLWHLWRRYQSTSFSEERYQLKLLGAGIFIPASVSILAFTVLAHFVRDFPLLSTIGPMSTIIFMLFTGYATLKQGHFIEVDLALEYVFNSISRGICVVQSDGRIIRHNQDMLDIVEYQGELTGKSIDDLLAYLESKQNGTVPPLRRWFEVRQPDSMQITLPGLGNKSVELVVSQLSNNRGKPVGNVLLFHDITDRKRAEEALRRSEEEFRLTFENAKDSIFWADPETGLITNCNKAAEILVEKSRDEIIGRHQTILHPPKQSEYHTRIFKRHIQQKGTVDDEAEVITKSGKTKPVHITASVTSVGGRPIVQGIFRDITEHKRAERALRESEERYRMLVEQAPDIICTINLKTGVISSANSFAEKALGYKLEQIVNKLSFLELVHAEDHEKVINRLHELSLEGRRLPNFPVRLKKDDGTYMNGEVNGAVTYDSEGNPDTFTGVIRDVTERKLAEEALRESEERYRTVVDNSLTGICLIQDGKYQFVNKRLVVMSGYSPRELSEMSFEQLVHPDDLELVQEAISQRLSGKGLAGHYQFRGITKNGDVGWLETIAAPVDYHGKPAVLMNVVDITDRKTAEEQIRESEEKYRRLFEESKDAILITTPEGTFVDINPAGVELYGYSSKEELLKTAVAQDTYMDASDREKFQEIIAKQGFVKDYELNLRRKDGQQLVVLLTANAVRDDNGDIVAYRGIIRDITEHKRLERQLFQVQKMESIGTLAGGIAHDFNNLLGGIMGYASLSKTKVSKRHPIFNYIDTIERSTMRAAELTSQLLAFARGGKYDIKPVDMNGIVHETLRFIGRTFDKSIEIMASLYPQLPTVEADAGQLQQVLMNLCVNAADAMPNGGKLTIETDMVVLTEDYVKAHMDAKAGSYVALSVTDTGIGMDKDTLQRIFEPFFTTKEEGKGTGLGLAMVYGVAKNHGGYIHAYSEPGEGATFKVYLPVSGKTEVKEPADTETPRGGNELILVVDDEESIRSVAADILESYGYLVLVAEDGEEAAKIYEEHNGDISLVILDMVMPRLGGRETFLKLKRLNPQVRALLSTGYSKNEKAQEILDSGVMGFVQKPYLLNELLSKVRSVLDAEIVG
jgi:PAS domain S-box-containing protein